jgi:SGNH hydrolase-like domain, acetyltransferase AlgX
MSPSRRTTVLSVSLVVLVGGWGAMGVLSRRPDLSSILAARQLFAWMFPATFFAVCGLTVALAHRRRLAVFRSLMVAISVVACLALLEVPAALKLVHWRVICTRWLACDTHYNLTYQFDLELGMRRPAHARWSERALGDVESGWSLPPARRATLTFSYDALGFRNPAALQKADVTLVGNSHIEGAYNDDADVVARRLEARLGRPVASLAVAGFGTMQALVVIDRIAPRFAPKVIVWFFFEGNDLYDDREFEAVMRLSPEVTAKGTGPEGMRAFHGWRVRSFSRNALALLRRWADPVFPNHAPYGARLASPERPGEVVLFADYARWPWTEAVAARWTKAQEIFRQGLALARQRGVHLLLAFIPEKFRVYRPYVELPPGSPMQSWTVWPIRESFADFCRTEAVACLDLTAAFQRALDTGGQPYALTDTHWSAEGHDIVAQAVKENIDKMGWLD